MKKIVLGLALIGICLTGSLANSSEWQITRITDNNYGEYGVRIFENKLVWQGYPEQGESEIFYYDGQSVHQLTDTVTFELYPEISSGGIVWAGNLVSWDGVGDVLFYDYDTITVLASNCVRQLDVDIFEDKIVWSDADTGQLMLYEKGNISQINGAFGWRPRMSSGGILYTFGDSQSPHLYLFDWNNIIDLGETTDSDADNNQPSQQINGNRVTWFKNVGGYEDNEVMLYDIPSKEMLQVTDGNKQYGQPMQPFVSGNNIAWYDAGNVGINPLNLYNGKQIVTIAESDEMSVSTFFSNRFLAWSMNYNDQVDFFVYDLILQETTQMTNDAFGESGFVAYGNRIAFLAQDGNDNEIFLAQYSWGTAYNALFGASLNQLEIMRTYRNEVLSKTARGRRYKKLLYKNSRVALKVLLENPELLHQAKELIATNKDAVSLVLDGSEGAIYNTHEIAAFLDAYAKESPPALKFLAKMVKRQMLRKQRRGKLFFGFRLK